MTRLLVSEGVLKALKQIASPGCEASDWANEQPNVWDRCLDPEYIEGLPDGRCGPCEAHAALVDIGEEQA